MTRRLAVVLLLLFPLRLAAAAPERADLDAYFRAHIAAEKIPGMVVGLFDGHDEWIRAYGMADVENQTPMKIDSSFRLASITKTMTAIAILQLAERGKVNLDAEVQTYVPYFPKKKWPVTVRQVLSHMGGIPHYVNRATEQHIKEHRTTREAIAIFENYDLVAAPGTKFSYSSYGYVLLGGVIESASGQTYEQYMRENIWGPLGMTSTRVDDPAALIPNRVRGYRLIDGKLANSEFIDISSRFAAGGLRTTVPDLLRLARGIIDRRLISAASWELMTTSKATREGELTENGFGCVIHPIPGYVDTNGRFAISNSGGQQETRTFIMIFPARNLAFATAMNAEIDTGEEEVQRLVRAVTGERLNFSATSNDAAERAVLAAMQTAFTQGLADVEAHRAMPPYAATLATASAYFDAIVDDAAKGVAEEKLIDRVNRGRQPAIGAPLTILGRTMAESLRGRRDYAAAGAPVFFRDYAAAHAGAFPRWLTSRLGRFAGDWTATATPEVRALSIDRAEDLEGAARVLRATFRGHEVVPNIAPQLAALVERLAVAGDARAAAGAALALELYPGDGAAQRAAAFAALASGDAATARTRLQRAEGIDPARDDYPDRLNRAAYAFARGGHVDRGVALLQIATTLHPTVANLFDSLGELSLLAGDKAAARAAYERALALDPKLKSAAAALEGLR